METHSPISSLGAASTLISTRISLSESLECDVTATPSGILAAQEQGESARFISENEKEFLAAQIAETTVKVKLGTIYRYADRKDKLILLLSIISAIAAGTAQPFMTVCTST
jgi:hypothetical protein